MPPASDSAATLPLIAAFFQFADVIAGAGGWGIGKGPGQKGVGLASSLRPETKTKLRVTRDKVEKEIKEEAIKEKREELEAEKAAAKKKAEDERLSKLSAADQKKVCPAKLSLIPSSFRTDHATILQELEREKKRLMRKSQGKGTKGR